MSIPQIRTEAIEAVGRKILMEYDPSLLSGQPCPVPIETIIETKFDLILEFHTLRKNPKILGETIFDDGAVVLYDQIQRQYRMIAVRAGTILIDERLCDSVKIRAAPFYLCPMSWLIGYYIRSCTLVLEMLLLITEMFLPTKVMA